VGTKAVILLVLFFLFSFVLAEDSLYIYIADWYNHRIVRIEDMDGTGWTEFGTYGTGVGEFDGPSWLLPAMDGKIYITDRGNGRIVRIDDMTGAGWTELSGFEWPRTIEQDIEGRFYIADDHAHNVVRIDDISGAGWTFLGSFGSGIGEFNRPAHVLPNSGKMFITDAFNSRLVRCDNMTTAGWTTYGTPGSGVGEFGRVLTVTLDSQGKIYLSDCTNNRVVRIDDMSGTGWTEYGSTGSGVGHFTHVNHVALDDSGRLYISDAYNHRIVRIDDMTGAGWTEFGTFGSGIGEFNGQTHIRLVNRAPHGVNEDVRRVPSKVEISAWPNPFNSAVTIAFDCHSSAQTDSHSDKNGNPDNIAIEIYDLNGRIVGDVEPCLVSAFAPLYKGGQGGVYIWRPDESLPSGLYLVHASVGANNGFDKLSRRNVGAYSATKRVVYLK